MKNTFVILFILVGTTLKASAQGEFLGPLSYKIVNGLNSDGSRLKDSVAFYSWAYDIKLKRFKDSTVVEKISVNDSIANVIVKDPSYLKSINFISLLGKRDEATLIIPISVILRDYNSPKQPTKKISFYDFSTRIRKLFNVSDGKEYNENYIYFQPIMVYLSKRIHDY